MSSQHYAIIAVERLVRVERYCEAHVAAPVHPTRHPETGAATGRATGEQLRTKDAASERRGDAQVNRRAGW